MLFQKVLNLFGSIKEPELLLPTNGKVLLVLIQELLLVDLTLTLLLLLLLLLPLKPLLVLPLLMVSQLVLLDKSLLTSETGTLLPQLTVIL